MLEHHIILAQAVPAAAQTNPVLSFLPLIFIFIAFYFLLLRPQQQRQKEVQKMIDSVKKGDKVVTSGGVIGVVTGIQSDYVVMRTGDNENTKMEVLKSAITGLRQ